MGTFQVVPPLPCIISYVHTLYVCSKYPFVQTPLYPILSKLPSSKMKIPLGIEKEKKIIQKHKSDM